MSFDPQNPPPNRYEAPHAQPKNEASPKSFIGPKPQVMLWQKVYLGFMVALYSAVTLMGIALFVFADDIAANDPEIAPTEMYIGGVLYGGLGVVLGLVFALGFVFNKGNGGWIYNTVLIGIGLTSCCLWPATIPLLIYWIQNKKEIVHYSS